jgi:transglutaminase-like putative cysteine protease
MPDVASPLTIRFGYELTMTCAQRTPMIAMLSIRDDQRMRLVATEQIVTTPEVPVHRYTDLFGNTCRRFVAPAGGITVWGDGTIADTGLTDPVFPDAREMAIEHLPDECLIYLLGSRYCETDLLSQTAWDLFGGIPPGWGRVQAVCDHVHTHIRFDYMAARVTRTAAEACREGTGVCRDFAHLAIAFLRCLNIPTRYVNGYLGDIGVPILDPMDFSAWIEVFLDGQWHTFDPRNNKRRIGRIVVSRGRDAADVPLIHSFGPHVLTGFRVWCYAVDPGMPLSNPPPPEQVRQTS